MGPCACPARPANRRGIRHYAPPSDEALAPAVMERYDTLPWVVPAGQFLIQTQHLIVALSQPAPPRLRPTAH